MVFILLVMFMLNIILSILALFLQATITFEVKYYSPDGRVGTWDRDEFDYPLIDPNAKYYPDGGISPNDSVSILDEPIVIGSLGSMTGGDSGSVHSSQGLNPSIM